MLRCYSTGGFKCAGLFDGRRTTFCNIFSSRIFTAFSHLVNNLVDRGAPSGCL